MTLRFSFLGLLPLLVLSGLNAQVAIQPATFRTNSQMVLVPVTVTDSYGKTIEGLRAEDFHIFEDQAPQKIVSFSREDAPCSVGVVLDISGSMRYTIGTAKNIAHSFIGSANPQDEFMLLTVSSQPEEAELGFTHDVASMQQSVGSTRPGGMTALIDTVYLGLSRMPKARNPRRALVILSDGMDNHSRYSKGELMRIALEADVQVYTILIDGGPSGASNGPAPFRPSMAGKPWDHAAEQQGPELLEELSRKTGGLYFRVHSEASAKEAAIEAGRALREQYVIGYEPSVPSIAGKWHQVRVKSTVPKINIYARNGYYSR